MDSNRRTVLITGGAGFIGGELIARLLGDLHQRVICLDKLTYSANRARLTAQLGAGLELEHVDLADANAVAGILTATRPDLIFHLAAESHVDRSIDRPGPFIETNVVGTLNLLQSALDVWRSMDARQANRFRLIHVSTDEVFGSAAPGAYFDEKTRYEPSSPYSATKAAADHLVRAWYATYGLPCVVTNTSNNYGPFQFPEKLIPHTIVRALTGEIIPVYGDGKQTRDWIHVSDHVEGLMRAAERGTPGHTFLLGARNAITNLELVDRICSILDDLTPEAAPYRSRIEFVSDRPGHDRRYAIDPTRAEDTLGWSPKVAFDQGLRDVVRWYIENEPWWRSILGAGYATDRLGAAK